MTNEKGEGRGSIVNLHAYRKQRVYRELMSAAPNAEMLNNGKVILVPEAIKGSSINLLKAIVQLFELATVKAFVIAHYNNRVGILVRRDTGIIPANHSEIRAIVGGGEAHDAQTAKLSKFYYYSGTSKVSVRQVAETVVRLLEESEE